jgi:hypothetical protein
MDKESVKDPVELQKTGVLRAPVSSEPEWRDLAAVNAATWTEIRVHYFAIAVFGLRVAMIP